MISSVKSFRVNKYWSDHVSSVVKDDIIPIEAPLQICIYDQKKKKFTELAITMRTPGADKELVAGFFLAEQLVRRAADIQQIDQTDEHTVQVMLDAAIDLEETLNKKRHFMVSSSCGVCGDITLKKSEKPLEKKKAAPLTINKNTIFQLSKTSMDQQVVFKRTGGLHASTLFAADGTVVGIREDVGRHNALDKLLGYAVLNSLTPLSSYLLLLSGRVSYELVQKAAMADIRCICALGAPSSLAVETARNFNITLIGFITHEKFNIYTTSTHVSINP